MKNIYRAGWAGHNPHITDYSALAELGKVAPHPWAALPGYVDDPRNYGKSIAVRFRNGIEYGLPSGQRAWKKYLIKELGKVEGGLNGITLNEAA